MAIVALACIGAGTWQIARFEQKVHANDDLRANAHRPASTVDRLLPLVGRGDDPSRDDVEFRSVRVQGTYERGSDSLVRNRAVDDVNGFLVLTPFRTARALLLVVRGFVPATASGARPDVPAPPAGAVTLRARIQAPETRFDKAAQLPAGQLESINPTEQAARRQTPVYDGYAELEAGQPGSAGLTALPRPDLSNPAGGALEPQHFAYVIQWYLFAALALAAPVTMARAELRQRRAGVPDYDERDLSGVRTDAADDSPAPGPDTAPAEAELSPEQRRAAKLADRYGHAR
jgi:cytochrome oxidase assembly protein ShyY1